MRVRLPARLFRRVGAEFSLEAICIDQWEFAKGVTFAAATDYGANGFADFETVAHEPANENFNVLSQSVGLGLELTELNTIGAQWIGIFSDRLENDFVVDFRAGVGHSGDSNDFFTGVGGGYRFGPLERK